jgi:hypothetical protein
MIILSSQFVNIKQGPVKVEKKIVKPGQKGNKGCTVLNFSRNRELLF